MSNPINPDHYNTLTPPPYQTITSWGLDFCLGNIVKYVVRFTRTNNVNDLKKAKQYLDFRIYELENNAN